MYVPENTTSKESSSWCHFFAHTKEGLKELTKTSSQEVGGVASLWLQEISNEDNNLVRTHPR